MDFAANAGSLGAHVIEANGVTQDTVPSFMERFGEAYAAEIRDFVRCIEESRAPTVSGEDARVATAISLAATCSLDEGRPVAVREVSS